MQQAGTTPPPEGVPTSDLSDVSESDRLPVPEQGARCTVHGARRGGEFCEAAYSLSNIHSL